MNPVRKHKLESLIQKELAEMILSGEVKDPRVGSHLSISQVSLNKDGSVARIYVTSWLELHELEKSVEALNHAQFFLFHLLAKKLTLRVVPRLGFFVDESISNAMAINKKIDQLVHASDNHD